MKEPTKQRQQARDVRVAGGASTAVSFKSTRGRSFGLVVPPHDYKLLIDSCLVARGGRQDQTDPLVNSPKCHLSP